MESAQTANKRRSLTLSSRLLQKRHSASPQSRSCASAAQETATKDAAEPVSPTVRIVENVESTPPNKMTHSLDDSLDFSPRNNLSPSCLFSQTLVSGSPEVSWRWNSGQNVRGDKSNTTNDSGFDSEEFGLGAARQQKDRRKQVRADAANEHRRKQLDNRQWRAQQIRDHELLKERWAKLHRQLDQQTVAAQPAATTEPWADTLTAPWTETLTSPWTETCTTPQSETFMTAQQETWLTPQQETPAAPQPETFTAPQLETVSQPETLASDPALADFLNDSDTDCFLLEASQQLESKVAPRQVLKQTPAATTPTSHHKNYKEKRSSFYMKFLEDESETEDWFVALDEAMLEATQPKKPRTSLQRYKSMPSNTAGDVAAKSAAVINGLATNSGSCVNSAAVAAMGKPDTSRIKRHASSHALSPASSSARGNLFGRRK